MKNKKILLISLISLFLSSSLIAQEHPYDIWRYAGERQSEIVSVDKIKVQDRRNHLIRMHSFCTNLGIPYNDLIYYSSIHFSDAHAPVLSRILTEYNRLRPSFLDSFVRRRIPEYLALYCVTETMMNNDVQRGSSRRGIWQIDLATAEKHGLVCTEYIDERLIRDKSAEVFAKEIKNLRDSTGNWAFALIAYRDGLKVLGNARKLSKDPNDFWEVYKYLPESTQTFMMNFMGTLNSYYFGRVHGIKIKNKRNKRTKTVMIEEPIDFSEYQHSIRIPLWKLKELNPQYLKNIVPASAEAPLPVILTGDKSLKKIKKTKE